MSESMVTLSPRGWGRNALRTGDVLLGGQLPVVVYDDVPYVPYGALDTIGWTTTVDGLPALLSTLAQAPEAEFAARRARLLNLTKSLFTPAGIFNQIGMFLKGAGDLRCQRCQRARPRIASTARPASSAHAHAKQISQYVTARLAIIGRGNGTRSWDPYLPYAP